MTKTETQEILDQARAADKSYDDCVDAIRFFKREAYLARTGSRYVKRSQLDGILNTIENLEKREKEIVGEILDLREKSGLTWEEFLDELVKKEGDR
jgi:hypothetical protein